MTPVPAFAILAGANQAQERNYARGAFSCTFDGSLDRLE